MNRYTQLTGKKGYLTYKHENRFIYSQYDPVSEAAKYLSGFNDLKKNVITCCGADYVNSLLLKKEIDLIISFEPVEFERTISSEKLIRVKHTAELETILLERNIHASDISLLIWQPLIETDPAAFIEPLKKLKDILLKASISANTANKLGFLESWNFYRNIISGVKFAMLLPAVKKTVNPAIVLSSGPSLEYNIDLIRKIQDKAYLFALPSALPFLQHEGIFPDALIAVDPGYGTYYHLSKYRRPLKMIAPLSISPSILRLDNLDPCIFSYAGVLENIYYHETNILISAPEGSVIINLLRILPLLGFDKALLVGQDFGYIDGRSHSAGGSFEEEFLSRSDYFSPLEMSVKLFETCLDKTQIEVNGKKIETNTALRLYFDHFTSRVFDIELLLPANAFNPISGKYRAVDAGDFDVYGSKKDIGEIFNLQEPGSPEQRKDNIRAVLSGISGDIKNNDHGRNAQLINAIFLNINDRSHLFKLRKITEQISNDK